MRPSRASVRPPPITGECGFVARLRIVRCGIMREFYAKRDLHRPVSPGATTEFQELLELDRCACRHGSMQVPFRVKFTHNPTADNSQAGDESAFAGNRGRAYRCPAGPHCAPPR